MGEANQRGTEDQRKNEALMIRLQAVVDDIDASEDDRNYAQILIKDLQQIIDTVVH